MFELKVEKGTDVQYNYYELYKSSKELKNCLTCFRDMANGIIELQLLGIYHLDLKLHNMKQFRVNNLEKYKIIDFDWAFKVNEFLSSVSFSLTKHIVSYWLCL